MIMAEMINLVPVMKNAKTELDCLLILFKALGTPDERTWPGVTELPNFHNLLAQWPSRHASTTLASDDINPTAADLLNCMLQLCPQSRWTASEALSMHAFFLPKPETKDCSFSIDQAIQAEVTPCVFSAANDELYNTGIDDLISSPHGILLDRSLKESEEFECVFKPATPQTRKKTTEKREQQLRTDASSPSLSASRECLAPPPVPLKRPRDVEEFLLCSETMSPPRRVRAKRRRTLLFDDFFEAALPRGPTEV